MKVSNKEKENKSKLGQIRMISESTQNSRTLTLNSKNGATLKKSNKSKASFMSKTSKVPRKINVDTTLLKEASPRPAININFKEIPKDISKEIPKSLLCNICKNLVKNPTKCYQCKALFCMECLLKVLEKNHKCPKCFKIISENLIKNADFDNEFKNTFIKCKYTACKESANLFDYEEHLKICPFKNIKDTLEIDNLVYFDSLPFNKDPYSNSVLMEYCVKKAKEDINVNNETTFVDGKEKIEAEYNEIIKGNGKKMELFKDIIESGSMFEDDIDIIDNRKKEVNDIVKELQSKITFHDIV